MTLGRVSQCLALSALAACLAAVSAPGTDGGATSGCRAADTVWVQARLEYFRTLLTTTDSARVAVRDSLGLSAVSASKVNFVTKQTTCVSAANALNTFLGEPGTSRLVWVYSLGGDYAVIDPDIVVPPGEDTRVYLFSRQWNYKATLVGI